MTEPTGPTATSDAADDIDLRAIEAIKHLKARYFRGVDTKDWATLRTAFADDFRIDLTDGGGGVLEGADAFVAFLQEMLAEATTIHLGHTPEITVTGPTTATGIWMLQDILVMGDTRMTTYGHLHDEYVRVDGDWKVRQSIVTVLHRTFD